MNIRELCSGAVVVAYRHTPLVEAARLMRDRHVGSVVVVVDRLSERVPVGMITDRDIALQVAAQEVELTTLTVGDVMTGEFVTAKETDQLEDVLRLMRVRGVRRVPVLTPSGALAGIIALEDIIDLVSVQLTDIAHAIDRERVRETRARR